MSLFSRVSRRSTGHLRPRISRGSPRRRSWRRPQPARWLGWTRRRAPTDPEVRSACSRAPRTGSACAGPWRPPPNATRSDGTPSRRGTARRRPPRARREAGARGGRGGDRARRRDAARAAKTTASLRGTRGRDAARGRCRGAGAVGGVVPGARLRVRRRARAVLGGAGSESARTATSEDEDAASAAFARASLEAATKVAVADAKLGVSDAGAAGVEEGLGETAGGARGGAPRGGGGRGGVRLRRVGGGAARVRARRGRRARARRAPARVDAYVSAAWGRALEAMDPGGRASQLRPHGEAKAGGEGPVHTAVNAAVDEASRSGQAEGAYRGRKLRGLCARRPRGRWSRRTPRSTAGTRTAGSPGNTRRSTSSTRRRRSARPSRGCFRGTPSGSDTEGASRGLPKVLRTATRRSER